MLVKTDTVAGPILTPFSEPAMGDPFPHSMEPQLRALGLATTLTRGVPSLTRPHTLCQSNEKLSSEKCRILKLLGVQMAVSDVCAILPLISSGIPDHSGLPLVQV